MVKYDAERDALQMTEFCALFSGGLKIAKNMLLEKLSEDRKEVLMSLFVGVLYFGVAAGVYMFRRNRIQR